MLPWWLCITRELLWCATWLRPLALRPCDARQRTDMRQVQRRGVVTHLADHRLILHQRLVGQAVGVPVAAVGGDVAGRRGGGDSLWPASRAHIARAVLEVVQPQHVDVRGVLHADPGGQVGVRVVQAGCHRQAGIASMPAVGMRWCGCCCTSARVGMAVGAARLAGDRQHGVHRRQHAVAAPCLPLAPAGRRSRGRCRRRRRTGCPRPRTSSRPLPHSRTGSSRRTACRCSAPAAVFGSLAV